MDRLRQALWSLQLLNEQLNPYAQLAYANEQICGMGEALSGKDEIIAGLETEAYTDSLTGLANRRGRDITLERIFAELAKEPRTGRRSSDIKLDGQIYNPKTIVVIAFDLDHFKSVNTDYGHNGGDAALRKVADQIKQRFRRENDCVVARDGGEEMSVTFVCDRDSALDRALVMAEEIRAAIQRNCHVENDKGKREITTSIGIAFAAKPEDLPLARASADKALYAAKEAGRNRVYWHHPTKDISVASPLNPRHTVADIGVGRPGAAPSAPQFAPS